MNRPRLAGMIAIVLTGSLAATALAAWSTSGSGAAAGRALTMPAGSAPTATASGGNLTVRWPSATFSNGTAVAGYLIRRYNAVTGAPATVGAGCSGTIATTTCTEQSVPAGGWTYTDTPVQTNWTGAESRPSDSVTPTAPPSSATAPASAEPRPASDRTAQHHRPTRPVATTTDAADLSVAIQANPDAADRTISYTITVVNHGPGKAERVALADEIPVGAQFVSVSSNDWSCTTPSPGSTGAVTCKQAAIHTGATRLLTLTIAVPEPTTGVSNTVQVGSQSTDPTAANDVATTTMAVQTDQQ